MGTFQAVTVLSEWYRLCWSQIISQRQLASLLRRLAHYRSNPTDI